MVRAAVCTIGDEILIGQIIDTNSSAISKALGEIGVRTTSMASIGDDREQIISTLTKELKDNDIVIVTGGLGPTKDDITKDALARLSGSKTYVEHAGQLEMVIKILHARGLDVLDVNRAQAMVPDRCEVIVNRLGTAPIMVFRFAKEDGFGHDCTLYSLPGVPFEAIGALDEIMQDIKTHHNLSDIHHKTIMTFGMAESALSKLIEPWETALPQDLHLAYLPNNLTGVRLRLSVYGGIREDEERRISAEFEKLKPILGQVIYSEKDDTLQNRIGELLLEGGYTMSAAESCTGGMISQLMTSVAGCSTYYLGSVTSYANSVKMGVLGVPEEIIAKHGAVSSETVAKMAEGVRRITGSDFSVATSGVAGPGGGSAEKPVGLVWVGVCTPDGTKTQKFQFSGDRARNVERFASSALNFLRLEIENFINC